MKILSFTFETALRFSEPVREHSFVLRCLPKNTPNQTVMDSQVIIAPRTPVAHQTDGFGNRLQIGRIEAAHDEFSFISTGLVVVDAADCDGEEGWGATEAPVADGSSVASGSSAAGWSSSMSGPSGSLAHPIYANPSTFAAADAAMRAFAQEASTEASGPWSIAQALSHAVHERLAYVKDVTDVSTTASQAFALGSGVCQDFAHVLIALLRSLGIPARYVNGLIVGEGATHAWVEMHDGTRWRGIDPTHDLPIDDTYIVLSHGRDFADCAIESGVFRGGARQDQRVAVQVFDQASQQ